jgi:hypothetical protein
VDESVKDGITGEVQMMDEEKKKQLREANLEK